MKANKFSYIFLSFLFVSISYNLLYADLPDLTINEEDIIFSKNSPEPSEVVYISATIRNAGDNYTFNTEPEPFNSHDYCVGVSSFGSVVYIKRWTANYFYVEKDIYLGKISILTKNLGEEDSDELKVEIRENITTGLKPTPVNTIPPLASKVIVSTYTTIYDWQDIIFDTAVFLSSGATYWICLENSVSISTNSYGIVLDSGTPINKTLFWDDTKEEHLKDWVVPLAKYTLFYRLFQCTNTVVSCYQGDPEQGATLLYQTEIAQPIPSGSSKTISFPWTAIHGSTDIYVVVDAPNIISETQENNNKAFKTIISVPTIPEIIFPVSPPDKATNVIANEPIIVRFSEDMDPVSSTQSITVKAIKDSNGVSIDKEILNKTVTYSNKVLTFQTTWDRGYTYLVTISTNAKDIYGNPLASPTTWVFTTLLWNYTFYPQDNSINVKYDEPIRITFNEEMDQNSLKNSLIIREIRDNNGNSIYGEPLEGNSEYSNKTFTFYPNLKKGYKYSVSISTMAKDIFGNYLLNPIEWSFSTLMGPETENKFIADDELTSIIIPAGATEDDYYIVIDTNPILNQSLTYKISLANDKIKKIKGEFSYPLDGSIKNLHIYQYKGSESIEINNLKQNFTITIPYRRTKGTLVRSGNNTLVEEKTLAIYWLDTDKGLWCKIPNSQIDTEKQIVYANISHCSVFALLGGSDTDLSHAYAYPVPWKPFDGKPETGTLEGGITFTGLGSKATIRIYTISGELVRTLDYTYSGAEEQQIWDGKNSEGKLVASGVYIYYIENEREHKTGKLVIIK